MKNLWLWVHEGLKYLFWSNLVRLRFVADSLGEFKIWKWIAAFEGEEGRCLAKRRLRFAILLIGLLRADYPRIGKFLEINDDTGKACVLRGKKPSLFFFRHLI